MISIKQLMAGAVLGLGMCGNAMAGVAKGDAELGAFGMIISPDDGDETVILGGTFGKMFTDHLQGKFSLSASGSGDVTTMFWGAGLDVLFGSAKSKVIPYLGVLGNIEMYSADDPVSGGSQDGVGFVLELHGGMKFFVSDRTALNFELKRRDGTLTVEDDFGNEFDLDTKETDFVVGINFYF